MLSITLSSKCTYCYTTECSIAGCLIDINYCLKTSVSIMAKLLLASSGSDMRWLFKYRAMLLKRKDMGRQGLGKEGVGDCCLMRTIPFGKDENILMITQRCKCCQCY